MSRGDGTQEGGWVGVHVVDGTRDNVSLEGKQHARTTEHDRWTLLFSAGRDVEADTGGAK